MPTDAQLAGAVSVITGARGVIGHGIVKELAAAGSDVVLQTEHTQQKSTEITDHSRAKVLVEEVEELGSRALAVDCDVSNAEQVSEMVERTIDTFGRFDVLVNNAGIVDVVKVEHMSEAEWDRVMDVNVKGMFLCARAVIPHLRETTGTIINNGSIASFGGAAGLAHYCASKHAIIGLTKTLALELAPDDVTVNAICPGIVDTPMWSEVLAPEPGQYEVAITNKIPLGRDQTPEDIGRLAVFLATNRNITGEAIRVDGGITSSAT